MATLGAVAQSPVDPWALQNRIGTTDARYALNTVLMPVSDLSYIDYRSGVMASGSGADTYLAMRVQPGVGMDVTVEVGNCVINTPNQGAYMCCLSEVTALTLSPSSSTGNRIDLVIARVYDDQNTAIGSAPGVRQFTVEVWEGDVSSGTPIVPNPTPSAGWIPLAEVRVPAGASSIAATDITDRRGPGLVARGGMRGLYGPDSVPGSDEFASPGAYPGDQRWVHNAGFQHQVYYGSEMGWRGVHNAMSFHANPPRNMSGIDWYKKIGETIEICSLTIPDPGTPYQILPTARIEAMFGRGARADFYIRLDSPTGRNVSWTTIDVAWNQGSDKERTGNIAPIMWGNLTGTHTLHLVGRLWEQENDTYGWGMNRDKPLSTLLNTVVYPSTVQPDGSGGATTD